MEDDKKTSPYRRMLKRLSLFFPELVYTRESLEEALDDGDIFYKPTDMLPFLQSALFDEKVIEVELDGDLAAAA